MSKRFTFLTWWNTEASLDNWQFVHVGERMNGDFWEVQLGFNCVFQDSGSNYLVTPQWISTALPHTPELAGIWAIPVLFKTSTSPSLTLQCLCSSWWEILQHKSSFWGMEPWEPHLFSALQPEAECNNNPWVLQNFKYFTCVVSTLSHAQMCHPWDISTALLSILSQLSQFAL